MCVCVCACVRVFVRTCVHVHSCTRKYLLSQCAERAFVVILCLAWNWRGYAGIAPRLPCLGNAGGDQLVLHNVFGRKEELEGLNEGIHFVSDETPKPVKCSFSSCKLAHNLSRR